MVVTAAGGAHSFVCVSFFCSISSSCPVEVANGMQTNPEHTQRFILASYYLISISKNALAEAVKSNYSCVFFSLRCTNNWIYRSMMGQGTYTLQGSKGKLQFSLPWVIGPLISVCGDRWGSSPSFCREWCGGRAEGLGILSPTHSPVLWTLGLEEKKVAFYTERTNNLTDSHSHQTMTR